MAVAADIAENLPFLRRFARALTGSQRTGDVLVAQLLEAALADDDLKQVIARGRVPLYRAFNRLWSSAAGDLDVLASNDGSHEATATRRLQRITPASRQALLLTTVEDFSHAEAASIMNLDEVELDLLVDQAIADIDSESSTDVLIIEDEPLISMQLEDLVKGIGHTVCGTAATRTQAQEIAARTNPGLILADIQLADGSSGLDAVDDIMATLKVPVIFITAYPERLLTGCNREPTYLVTKPFREATVRAAISQALFFNSSAPVG